VKRDLLDYRIAEQLRNYRGEETIEESIPYSELVSWLRPTIEESQASALATVIRVLDDDHFLDESDFFTAFRGQALDMMRKMKKYHFDSAIVRIPRAQHVEGVATIEYQHATYSQQAGTNLVLDWSSAQHALRTMGKKMTLRAMLLDPEHKLPPLDTPYLANTLGVACILLYREAGEWLPYLPRRAKKKVAVFEGGFHCTASAVCPWPETTANSLADLAAKPMKQALWKEMRIPADHVTALQPAALCREFTRGGKPQIFFVGTTDLSRDDLEEAQRDAIVHAGGKLLPVQLLRKSLAVPSLEELLANMHSMGLTLEAVANLQYVKPFLDALVNG